MKNFALIITLLTIITFNHDVNSQCSNFVTQFPGATQSTTSTSLSTVTTCAYGGEYAAYDVTAGETYTWTTCGDTDFDTQLSLWNTAQTVSYADNDDDCGLQSTITWTATFTGTVLVLVSEFFCSSNSTCMTIEWACNSCGVAGSGCINTISFGSAIAPTGGTTATISTCNFQTEYSPISSVVAGETYQVTSDCGGYVTVRSGTFNGPVVSSGNAPLTWTATTSGDHYIHWNTDSSCGTATNCCETAISCVSCIGAPASPQDCEGANIVCSNNSFSGNSSGLGIDELDFTNEGCLSGENQSSWYYINVGTGGTLEMDINPVAADDYDFAIWGPYTSATAAANCSPTEPPIRCSWAAGVGSTGLGNGAMDNSEGVGGDDWVAPLNTSAGDIYILLIDNFSASFSPFDLNWGGSTVLDCAPVTLPVSLIDFAGIRHQKMNELFWSTASESNNDYFIIEHSSNGQNWKEIEKVSGAGNSNIKNSYFITHRDFENGINYYRLKQVDFDGTLNTHGIVSIDNSQNSKLLKRVNSIGQEVDEGYKGIVFEYYSDGSVVQIYQN